MPIFEREKKKSLPATICKVRDPLFLRLNAKWNGKRFVERKSDGFFTTVSEFDIADLSNAIRPLFEILKERKYDKKFY